MPPNQENTKQKWPRDIFFVLACIGAAVGLGNLWRFPYVAYENGGGAFLLPYVIFLLFAGIPIALLEIGVGQWCGGSVAKGFQKVGRRWTWIGWWTLVNSIVIVFYYAMVMSWCVQYTFFSVTEAWGEAPDQFFMERVLQLTSGPHEIGGINWGSLGGLAAVWFVVFLIVRSGTRGLSRVLMITVPVPLILLVLLAWRSLQNPGATEGLRFFLTPDLKALGSTSVWAAAASQVVLSLGLGMGQMVAYASRRKSECRLVRSGVTICGADLLFSILAGIAVFGTMGVLAHTRGVSIPDLQLDGLFLAFVSYPMALSSLPFAPLWGLIFFVLLLCLGVDSIFAVVEANLTGLEDIRLAKSRTTLAAVICSVCFLGGVVFSLGGGLYWLDIVDHWVAYYAIAAIIILQCIVFVWIAPIREIARPIEASVGRTATRVWRWIITIVPVLLIVAFGGNLLDDLSERYSGYPLAALLVGGWGIALASVLCGWLIARAHNRRTLDK